MIRFYKENGALIARLRNETVRIEGWGKNALRVRATLLKKMPEDKHALTEKVQHNAVVTIDNDGETAEIVNGRIKATINCVGIITFYKDTELILQEYYSYYYGSIRKEAICYKTKSREYKGLSSEGFKLTVRFESDADEKLFGMGQYQMPILNLKGTVLPLEQRNSQVSVPFVISSKGYGMLWNNPQQARRHSVQISQNGLLMKAIWWTTGLQQTTLLRILSATTPNVWDELPL